MKRTMIVGGLLAGGLLLGSGVALADDGSTAAADPICTERLPKALARIDTLVARIDGDASTKGSTAWLSARADRVRSTHPALADLLDQRAAARPAKVQELQSLKSQLQDVQAKDCR